MLSSDRICFDASPIAQTLKPFLPSVHVHHAAHCHKACVLAESKLRSRPGLSSGCTTLMSYIHAVLEVGRPSKNPDFFSFVAPHKNRFCDVLCASSW